MASVTPHLTTLTTKACALTPAAPLVLLAPAAKYIFQDGYETKWRWPVAVLGIGLSTVLLRRFSKLSVFNSFVSASVLHAASHTLTRLVPIPDYKRDPLNTASEVLNAVLPEYKGEGARQITYYYVATQTGFVLVLTSLTAGDISTATHSCDPHSSISPMCFELRTRTVRPDLYTAITEKMITSGDTPAMLAVHGNWHRPRNVQPSNIQTFFEDWDSEVTHAQFNLKPANHNWENFTATPGLRGIKFNVAAQECDIWAHEANPNALDNHLSSVEATRKKIATALKHAEERLTLCRGFAANSLSIGFARDQIAKLLKHPSCHSKKQLEKLIELTEGVNGLLKFNDLSDELKPQVEELTKCIWQNTEEYIDQCDGSVVKKHPTLVLARTKTIITHFKKKRYNCRAIKQKLAALLGQKSTRLRGTLDRYATDSRWNSLGRNTRSAFNREKDQLITNITQALDTGDVKDAPNSALYPTIQIKSRGILPKEEVQSLLREKLRAITDLFTDRGFSRLLHTPVLPTERRDTLQAALNSEPFTNLITRARVIILAKAQALNDDDNVDLVDFESDMNFFLDPPPEDVSNRKKRIEEKFEWITTQLGKLNNTLIGAPNAQLDEEVEWYKDYRDALYALLEQTGRMTFELQERLRPLDKDISLLDRALDGQPIHYFKRMSSEGAVLFSLQDPIAHLNEVHMPLKQD